MAFSLRKWYFDCVDPRGRSAIVYWSALEWGPVRARWHEVSLHAPGVPARHASSSGTSAAPAARAGGIGWASRALDAELRCAPLQPPFGAALLPGADGLDWRCEAPAGRMRVRLGPELVEGVGYAERLELRRPPWRLPVEALRWGRWIEGDGRHAVAWIDWRGAERRSLAWIDGRPAARVEVEDDGVAADRVVLRFVTPRLLHERSLVEAFGAASPLLARLPAGWLRLEDRKWINRLAPGGSGLPPEEGWAIHERILWP